MSNVPTKFHFAVARFVRALRSHPQSREQLALAAGLHVNSVEALLKAFRHEKTAHIAGYAKCSRGHSRIQLFRLGPGPDAVKPPPLPNAEKVAAYRERVKQKRRANSITNALFNHARTRPVEEASTEPA